MEKRGSRWRELMTPGSDSPQVQRMLARESTSYKELVVPVKRDAALSELADERASLTDIAHRLGFSEQSALSRAFRSWTGIPPSVYRARRLGMRSA